MTSEYPRVGVGVIILNGKKVLLGLRKGNRSPGYYGLPGGYLENHENFEECAKREVFEETGLMNVYLQPICIISGSSESIHYADVIFYTSYKNGKPYVKEKDRVVAWEWFNIFDLPSPLYIPTELALKHFVSNYYYHKINYFFSKWFSGKRRTVLYVDSVNNKR